MFFQRFRPLTSWNLPREHSILCKSPLWAYLRNAALAKTCKTEAKQTNRTGWLCGCKVFFNPCPSGKKNSSTFKSLVGGIQQVATRESQENCWKGTPKQGMLHLCTERLQPSEQCPVDGQVEGSSSNLIPAKGISRFQTKVSICINTPLRIIAAWEKTWHELTSTQSYTSVIIIIIIIFTTATTANSRTQAPNRMTQHLQNTNLSIHWCLKPASFILKVMMTPFLCEWSLTSFFEWEMVAWYSKAHLVVQ